MEQGLEQGRAEGLAQGELKAKLEMTRKLKESGLAVAEIAKVTGLTETEIAGLD